VAVDRASFASASAWRVLVRLELSTQVGHCSLARRYTMPLPELRRLGALAAAPRQALGDAKEEGTARSVVVG
jgi:hypothetical protein